MLKLLLVFSLFSTAANAFDETPTRKAVAARLLSGDTRGLAAEAMGNMLETAARELDHRGFAAEARGLRTEWNGHYRFTMLGLLSDVGDHKPLSDWVAKWYGVIAEKLGDNFMELSHLKDIWVLNATIPVIFDPKEIAPWCVDQLIKHPGDKCKDEYRRHFAGTKWDSQDPYATDEYNHHGFAGVVTYWVVWGVCEGATYGSGAFMVCTPIASVAETLIERYVAPKASDRIWDTRS